MLTYYSIEELNDFVYDKCLCLYQKLIVDKEGFGLDVDGNKYLFLGVKVKQLRNMCYFKSVDGSSIVLLASKGSATGYQISGSLVPCADKDLIFDTSDVVVCVGHPNYAHFVWNQLSAVLKVFKDSNVLFSEAVNSIISLSSYIDSDRIIDTPLGKATCKLLVGSTIFSCEAQAVIKSNTTPCSTDMSKEKKYVYLGIRGAGKRELINENQFYKDLIIAVSKQFDNTFSFVLDGFSFQNNNLDNEGAIKRCAEVEGRINDIKQVASKKDIDCTSINGLKLNDFFSHLEYISFYVTHEGTMQHKLGWFDLTIPGYLITGGVNPGITARWHLRQVECSGEVEQKIFSPRKGSVLRLDQDDIPSRNSKISFVDEEEAINDILNALSTCLLDDDSK